MLVGLRKKSKVCKICCSFDDNMLNEITLDCILQRRTWADIKEYYTPFLPKGVAPLSDINIKNHKKHSDPALLAKNIMERGGIPHKESDVVAKLYSDIFADTFDRSDTLSELYKERLKNLKLLQDLLNDKKHEYCNLSQIITKSAEDIENMGGIQKQIRVMTKEIDKIQGDIQDVLIRERSVDKGLNTGNITYITQNYVNVFQGHLKGFIEEIVPYLLMNIFKDDPELGKAVVQYISDSMDKHLAPAFEESKLLTPANLTTRTQANKYY